MKKKIFMTYLGIYSFVVVISSGIYISQLINMLDIPKGIVYAVVNYGFYLVHFGSFAAMLYYGKELS